jgi:hypothetical protein
MSACLNCAYLIFRINVFDSLINFIVIITLMFTVFFFVTTYIFWLIFEYYQKVGSNNGIKSVTYIFGKPCFRLKRGCESECMYKEVARVDVCTKS